MSKYLDLAGLTAYDKKIKEWIKSGVVDITNDSIRELFITPILYQMVDLGLPSGLKWADRNVGAASPEDAGLYFQWGDTVGYTANQVGVDKVFNWDNYKFGTKSNLTKYNSTDGLKALESIDDAVTVHMGSNYRMPAMEELLELINNTTQTFIDVDGKEYKTGTDTINIEPGKFKGVRFTGSNGNSIFIPAAGFCNESLLNAVGMSGGLWSSGLIDGDDNYTSCLGFGYIGNVNELSTYRCYGRSVRGVQS